MELGPIAARDFRGFIETRFAQTGRFVGADVVDRVLAITLGHPYATQELCYSLWEAGRGRYGRRRRAFDEALVNVLRSEHAHFSLIWGPGGDNPAAAPPSLRGGTWTALLERLFDPPRFAGGIEHPARDRS